MPVVPAVTESAQAEPLPAPVLDYTRGAPRPAFTLPLTLYDASGIVGAIHLVTYLPAAMVTTAMGAWWLGLMWLCPAILHAGFLLYLRQHPRPFIEVEAHQLMIRPGRRNTVVRREEVDRITERGNGFDVHVMGRPSPIRLSFWGLRPGDIGKLRSALDVFMSGPWLCRDEGTD